MILLYDGTKTLFLENANPDEPLTMDKFNYYCFSKMLVGTIVVESITGNNGSMLVGLPIGKPEDRTVSLDYSNVNVVWAKEISKEEAAESKILETFIAPVHRKISKLLKDIELKKHAEEDARIKEKLTNMIAQAKQSAKEATNDKPNMEIVSTPGTKHEFFEEEEKLAQMTAGNSLDLVNNEI